MPTLLGATANPGVSSSVYTTHTVTSLFCFTVDDKFVIVEETMEARETPKSTEGASRFIARADITQYGEHSKLFCDETMRTEIVGQLSNQP